MVLQVEQNVSLKKYNTFGVEATAARLIEIDSVETLQMVLQDFPDVPKRVLGGGSNVLIAADQAGIVLKNNIKGRKVIDKSASKAIISIGSGENWHELVRWTLEQDFGGLENLSLIPGTVGAAPIQNIGAYGVEQASRFLKLEAVELSTGELKTFYGDDCHFGYRDSVFKQIFKDKYFITRVFYLLSTQNHVLNTTYGIIEQMLSEQGIAHPTIQDVSKIICHIRSSKLPAPEIIGNAGSFFKNPVLDGGTFRKLQNRFPDLAFYEQEDGYFKIPAAWLIDQCGWKGHQEGQTGCYKNQPLVLVNYGTASGAEIQAFAHKVAQSVKDKFDLQLEQEVNVWA